MRRRRGGGEQERIRGRGPRQHVAGCIGSLSRESTSTIIGKLFYMIAPNLSQKLSLIIINRP